MSMYNRNIPEIYPQGFDGINKLSTPLSPELYQGENRWMDNLQFNTPPPSTGNSAYKYNHLDNNDLGSREVFDIDTCFQDGDIFDHLYESVNSESSTATSTCSPNLKHDERSYFDGVNSDLLMDKLVTLKKEEGSKSKLMDEFNPNHQESENKSEQFMLDSCTMSETSSVSDNKPRRKSSRKSLTSSQKQAHNKIEKKYRININAKIAALQKLIPSVATKDVAFETGKKAKVLEHEGQNKLNKSMILERAKEYIILLQRNEDELLREVQALRNEVVCLREYSRLPQQP